MSKKNINQLISSYLLGRSSEEESAQLEKWLQADPRHQEFLGQFAKKKEFSHLFRQYMTIDEEQAWQVFEQQTIHAKQRLVPLSPRFYRIAAVILILLVGGAFWYHREYTRVTPPMITEEVQLAMEQSRESGRAGADIVSSVTSREQVISQEECDLYHVDEGFVEHLEEAKRITTRHDKEYWVTLDDGTLVHLNYNSRLIYPEKFGDRRDVILDGEAYFMVAKDKRRKFVVHTPQGDVKVYGTEFNVNTRKDEEAVSVVLVNGSVSFVSSAGKEMMMQPGQELTAVDTQLLVTSIDTAPYVAWNTGLFVFKNSTLEYIMDVLSQWYGIHQVNYANDSLRKICFTGNLKRYGNIDRILEAIMLACDLKIQLSDDTITIQE
ncbi:MAG: FecR domain-containing protein [Prevotella sp.]|nr:FecR domain-containing protein [Prevotella sp.]